ncbi:uncharacterized protein LOC113503849 [Trichoplusia ni]|uniref:Uncharacterized protein LOC113503849 n=1 Tax=Trichoplusia ni TaxID=7111 RepID=A0A7E5WLY3_TRINI|nr:uncharacterized protein LOC113503849 [Trichoplusia ni]XP_026741761.1 uncharacterized protein LOC113503849 [Trichoplusia ni]
MRAELPEFKRCCCCFPLRYGLMTWGYLKLISSCLLLITFTYALYFTICRVLTVPGAIYYYEEITIYCIFIAILTLDATFTTVFVVGGHQKSPKLLRVYYIYGMVVLVLLLIMLSIMTLPFFFFEDSYTSFRIRVHMIDVCSIFLEIMLQTYFLLLVRSEMVKLNSNCEFRFVNNAAQAECVMTYQENRNGKVTAELKKENYV